MLINPAFLCIYWLEKGMKGKFWFHLSIILHPCIDKAFMRNALNIRKYSKKKLLLHRKRAKIQSKFELNQYKFACNHSEFVQTIRRNGRVVECGGLENRCTLARTGGSNPSFSADKNTTAPQGAVLLF